MSSSKRLGVGFIGSGFITKFHLQSWQAVRDADVLGLWSPNAAHAAETAAYARSLGVGETRAYRSITEMVADPAIDAAIARAVEENAWPLLAAGRIAPVMDHAFPLIEAHKAHARIESSAHIGKIVLTL